MTRNRRPRKSYRPQFVDPDPVGLAIARACLLASFQRSALIDPMREAFDAMRTGHGGANAWCTLADAMNVAEALCELRIANDHLDKFNAGQDALAALHDRVANGGNYTLKAGELVALQDALEIQLEHCTQGELATAIERVKRRVAAALRGSPPAGARICNPGALGRAQAAARADA